MGHDTAKLVTILAPLVELEKQAASCTSLEEYHALRRSGEATNTQVLSEIKAVVKECGFSLQEMRELYYSVLRDRAYADEVEARANVMAILNEAFEGVGGWSR